MQCTQEAMLQRGMGFPIRTTVTDLWLCLFLTRRGSNLLEFRILRLEQRGVDFWRLCKCLGYLSSIDLTSIFKQRGSIRDLVSSEKSILATSWGMFTYHQMYLTRQVHQLLSFVTLIASTLSPAKFPSSDLCHL